MRLVALVGLLLCAVPSQGVAQALSGVPALASPPFTANPAAQSDVAFVQQHVLQWVRRWGTAVDGPKEVEARLGPDGLAQLLAARGPYAALLVGNVTLVASRWTAVLTLTTMNGGVRSAEFTVTARSFREFLDGLADKGRAIAEAVAAATGRPMVEFVPPTRAYATFPLILGGAGVATGVTFFALAGVEKGKIGAGASLPDALSARNAGNTYNVLGYTLTGVGVVSLVVGVFLFKPGATPAPVSVSVDPAHGTLLLSGPLP